MQGKRDFTDNGMMLLPSLEAYIPEDHPLRKLDRVLDLSFVHDEVRDRYCQYNGRPSIDPEVVIRLFLLQAIENIPSVRKLLRDAHVNLAYRWFIGYRVDEKLPDHSTLSRALDRFGDEVFDRLFKDTVARCQDSGLLEGKVLHLDATTIRADLDANKVNKPNSSDKDARFGHFPDGNIKPGYKQDTIADGKRRVIVGVDVKPANASDDSNLSEMVDDVIDRLGVVPEALCADRAYGSGKNCASLEERGVRLISPPAPAKSASSKYSISDFRYDESRDCFTCPAGKQLSSIGIDPTQPNRKRYRARRSACGACKLKPRCTNAARREIKVGLFYGALLRLRKDYLSKSFKRYYARRAAVIEGVFAEAKEWHGLGRAWRRGLMKMRVQSYLIASVMNYKRLGALCRLILLMKLVYEMGITAIRRVLSGSKKALRFIARTHNLQPAAVANMG